RGGGFGVGERLRRDDGARQGARRLELERRDQVGVRRLRRLPLRLREGDRGHEVRRREGPDQPQRQRGGRGRGRGVPPRPPGRRGAGLGGVTASAIAQADHFLAVAAPQPGELPPVLDLETTGKLSKTRLLAWTLAWLEEVYARTGVDPFVYTSPLFWSRSV